MGDERLKKMKEEYDNIQIPENLRSRVELGIQTAKAEKEKENSMQGNKKIIVFGKRIAGGVAAALLAITIMTNSGAAIAHAMEKIPVIGAIAKVVTFREYEDTTNQMEANIKIPEVSVENEDGTVNQESTEQINKSIKEYTDEIIAQYEADVEAAGGEGMMDLQVDYTVMSDNERLFSIRFDESVVMAGSNHTVMIYHIDKQTGEMIKLSGLFKENADYINPISQNIKEQMKEQMEADENVYYWLEDEIDEWNFTSITENTNFYINEEGKLVIVFDKYEVAPGYMGSVEFVIPTEVIQDLVQDGFVK